MNLAVRRQLQLDQQFAKTFNSENAQWAPHALVTDLNPKLTFSVPHQASTKITTKKPNEYKSKNILLIGAALVAVLLLTKQ